MPVYRTVRYFCPHCQAEQYFFTLKPAMTDRWRCRKCHKKFGLDAPAVAATWASAIGLWSTPLAFLIALVVVVAAAPLAKLPQAILMGIACVGPTMMFCSLLLFGILGFFIGYIYALTALRR